MILAPKYKKHSEYLGKVIYKRIAGTGTSGGAWMVNSVSCKSLTMAKKMIEFYNMKKH